MRIRIREQTWRALLLGAALASVGLAAPAAARAPMGQPTSAPGPPAPGASEVAAESLADRLRRAAGNADWAAIESGLDELERHLGSGDAPRPQHQPVVGIEAGARGDGVARSPGRRTDSELDADPPRVLRSHRARRGGEAWGEHWAAFGERAGERWGAFGERTGRRWGELGERAGTRWNRVGNEMGYRFEEMGEKDLPEAIELTIETVLDAFDTLLESLGRD